MGISSAILTPLGIEHFPEEHVELAGREILDVGSPWCQFLANPVEMIPAFSNALTKFKALEGFVFGNLLESDPLEFG